MLTRSDRVLEHDYAVVTTVRNCNRAAAWVDPYSSRRRNVPLV
jgi:hypothetical protein